VQINEVSSEFSAASTVSIVKVAVWFRRMLERLGEGVVSCCLVGMGPVDKFEDYFDLRLSP